MHYYTQDKLGDVVYAELPEKGLELEIEGLVIMTMIYGRVWVQLQFGHLPIMNITCYT